MSDEDAAAVLRSLGLPPARTIARAAGFDASVWRVELADTRVVAVRLLREHHSPAREVAALQVAARIGVPVPRVLATGSHHGRAAVVSTWCAGRPVGELLAGARDDAEVSRLGRQFGLAHAQLHRTDPTGTDTGTGTGTGTGRPDALPVLHEPAALLHLDYQPFNVLSDGERVTGIVDWGNAALGDPRADLARTRVLLAIAPALIGLAPDTVDRFGTAWWSGYAEAGTPPSPQQLAPWLVSASAGLVAEWEPRVSAGEQPRALLRTLEEFHERVLRGSRGADR